jgi:hypothetical protein
LLFNNVDICLIKYVFFALLSEEGKVVIVWSYELEEVLRIVGGSHQLLSLITWYFEEHFVLILGLFLRLSQLNTLDMPIFIREWLN